MRDRDNYLTLHDQLSTSGLILRHAAGHTFLAESAVGQVSVAARRDVIWMKRSRNSDRDRVDISELEDNDADRKGS